MSRFGEPVEIEVDMQHSIDDRLELVGDQLEGWLDVSSADVRSGVTSNQIGEGAATVLLQLEAVDMRTNQPYQPRLLFTADGAESVAAMLLEAAVAARRDLEAHEAGS